MNVVRSVLVRVVYVIALTFLMVARVWAQEALCAEVKIEIPQSVSLERQAFNAKLVWICQSGSWR
jgi:hypothetical protein